MAPQIRSVGVWKEQLVVMPWSAAGEKWCHTSLVERLTYSLSFSLCKSKGKGGLITTTESPLTAEEFAREIRGYSQ